MKTVMQEQDGRRESLPLRVQEALGELAGAATEGLLALSVGVGLGVLSEMTEAELDGGLVVGRSPSPYELRKSRTVVSSSFDRLAGQIDSERGLHVLPGDSGVHLLLFHLPVRLLRRVHREEARAGAARAADDPAARGAAVPRRLPAHRSSDRHPRQHPRRRRPLIWTTP